MTVEIPFNKELEVEYGVADQVSPLIRRVVARNPSAFTFKGTGTYILGQGEVAVVDPGPNMPEHVEAILKAVAGEKVTHILITHTHADHSPAAAPLKEATGATTYGYGRHGAGKSEDGIQIEEGGDMDFTPDVEIRDGDIIEGSNWSVECVYTPGHTSNHMAYQLREEKALLTGDHVMGWATSVIGPPDGDMAQYMESLRKLLSRDDNIYWPTHGSFIDKPKPYVKAFIAHREDREDQILDCLTNGLSTIKEMVPVMYKGYPEFMFPAAGRSVYAHMIHMAETGRVTCSGEISIDAKYGVAG